MKEFLKGFAKGAAYSIGAGLIVYYGVVAYLCVKLIKEADE